MSFDSSKARSLQWLFCIQEETAGVTQDERRQRVASTHSFAVNADVRRGRRASVGKATRSRLMAWIPE
ncbi:hypothetical protein BN2476_1240059 [Paraburkholderia piptadeniae]|uniref:Uncharacterized protein n=1 Tax=Paraburkholderia piptadeniae TaxID=1701573 RepID=A0A1N7SVU7_9BURK|nr:hypothetical protein BN2476_1240059 [Paraburkholderia piptadeniae]